MGVPLGVPPGLRQAAVALMPPGRGSEGGSREPPQAPPRRGPGSPPRGGRPGSPGGKKVHILAGI